MILALVNDTGGRPICTEILPGKTADTRVLLPIVARLRERFGITRACVVADRGMISATTIAALEEQGMEYILGARERSSSTVRNEAEAAKDRSDRQVVVAGIEAQLKKGDKALVGNSAYRRYLRRTDNAAIRGHVFCSFLALTLAKELTRLCEEQGVRPEWKPPLNDLDRLQQATIEKDGKAITTRTHVSARSAMSSRLQGSRCRATSTNSPSDQRNQKTLIVTRALPRPTRC